MIDYKKYIQVLNFLDKEDWFEWEWKSNNEKATAICELFDTEQVITENNIYKGTPKIDMKPFTDWWTISLDLNRVTC